ncbi:hypothetical protein ACFLRW_06950 [Acidobacteriota bacterium]
MELLYIAGIFMMVAILLKIGFVVYKTLRKEKDMDYKKNIGL